MARRRQTSSDRSGAVASVGGVHAATHSRGAHAHAGGAHARTTGGWMHGVPRNPQIHQAAGNPPVRQMRRRRARRYY